MSFEKKDLFIILSFIIPILIILLFWNFSGFHWNAQVPDYVNFYYPVGKNLAEGKGFFLNGKFASRYPPGYPLIISLIIRVSQSLSVSYVLLLKILILISWSFSFLLVFKIFNILLPKDWAFYSSIIWISNPFNLYITRSPLSENFFIPFYYLSLFLLIHLLINSEKNYFYKLFLSIVSGFALGIGALIRPIVIGIPFIYAFLIVFFLKKSLSWDKIIYLLIGLIGSFILTIFPWQKELNEHTNSFKLLSSGGFPSIRDGLTCFVETKGYRDELKINQSLRNLSTEALKRKRQNKLENYKQLLVFFKDQYHKNKIGLISLFLTKAYRSWFAIDSQKRKQENYNKIFQLIFLFFVSIGIYLSFFKFRFKNLKPWFITIGLLVLYNWAITILVLSILRYMICTISLLSIFIGITLFYIYDKIFRVERFVEN